MSLTSLIKSKLFLKHLAIALVSISLLFWSGFKFLNVYTLHGQGIQVPDFSGLKINQIDTFILHKKLNYLIIDSVYDFKAKKGIVIKQDPEPNNNVKDNRTIYLTVTAMLPPQVKMPKLQDRSLRQAMAMLETYGLKLGKTQYIADQCLNCVLDQLVQGKKIEAGTIIKKGAMIDLIIGMGLGDEALPIPNLLGMTRSEALAMLTGMSLSEGSVTFDSSLDTIATKVYKQIPNYSKNATIKIGSSIDLFFTNKADKLPVVSDTL